MTELPVPPEIDPSDRTILTATELTVYLHPDIAALLDKVCDHLERGRSEAVSLAVMHLADATGCAAGGPMTSPAPATE